MSDIEQALAIAEKVKDAIVPKFPKYVGYVRRYETSNDDAGYIELMIKPENGSRADELTTAYADEFFLSMLTLDKEGRQEKARRVLNDFKLLVGAK